MMDHSKFNIINLESDDDDSNDDSDEVEKKAEQVEIDQIRRHIILQDLQVRFKDNLNYDLGFKPKDINILRSKEFIREKT